MNLVPLTLGETAARLTVVTGGDGRGAAPAELAELIRHLSTALGRASGRALMARLGETLGPVAELAPARVQETIEQLRRGGDLTAGPGHRWVPAPLRAIRLRPGRYLLACGAPSQLLAEALDPATITRGVRREAAIAAPRDAILADRLLALGGRVLSLERWSGLEGLPPAGEAWLRALGAGSGTFLEKADWDHRQVYVPRAGDQACRWGSDPAPSSPALFRARREGGWGFAWGVDPAREGATPRRLTRDEALRTMFSLDRRADLPLAIRPLTTGRGFRVPLVMRLPRPEYRYLSALALSEGGPSGSFELAPEDWFRVERCLSERLGLRVQAPEGASC